MVNRAQPAAHVRPPRRVNGMKCYPLGIAAHIAIALDCIRRGDLDGAAAALNRAAVLSRGAPG